MDLEWKPRARRYGGRELEINAPWSLSSKDVLEKGRSAEIASFSSGVL